MDGGCCTNQGIHHLDMLRYLVGEVKRVNSTIEDFQRPTSRSRTPRSRP